MKIKKLNADEIKKIREKIESLKGIEYYKYYFCGDDKYPIEAYTIDNYYIDFTEYHGKVWIGVIRLDRATKNCFYKVLELIKERLEEYGALYMWCFTENKVSMKFHKYMVKQYKATQLIDKGYSVIEVLGGK